MCLTGCQPVVLVIASADIISLDWANPHPWEWAHCTLPYSLKAMIAGLFAPTLLPRACLWHNSRGTVEIADYKNMPGLEDLACLVQDPFRSTWLTRFFKSQGFVNNSLLHLMG